MNSLSGLLFEGLVAVGAQSLHWFLKTLESFPGALYIGTQKMEWLLCD